MNCIKIFTSIIVCNIIAAIKSCCFLWLLIIIGSIIPTVVSVCFIIPHLVVAYYTIIVSPQFGLIVKFIILCTSPLLICIYPLLILVSTLFLTSIGGHIYIYSDVLERYSKNKYIDMCLSINIFSLIYSELLHPIVKFECIYFFRELKKFRIPRQDGYVIEIPIIRLLIGILIMCFGMVIDFVMMLILSILKFVPGIFRMEYYAVSSWYHDYWMNSRMITEKYITIPFYAILIILIPAICAFLSIIISISGLIFGIVAGYNYIRTESIEYGVKYIFHIMYICDRASNNLIFIKDYSILSCFNFETMFNDYTIYDDITETLPNFGNSDNNVAQYQVDENSTGKINLYTVWCNFFKMCTTACIDLVSQNNLIEKEQLESYDSTILLGIPSFVIFNALERSISIRGIIMSDGKILNNTTRPKDFISTQIYRKLIVIKNLIRDLKLTQKEILYIKKVFIVEKTIPNFTLEELERAIDNDITQIVPEMNTNISSEEKIQVVIDTSTNVNEQKINVNDKKINVNDKKFTTLKNRIITLHRIISEIQAVSINISKMPMFKDKMGKSINEAIEKLNNIQIDQH